MRQLTSLIGREALIAASTIVGKSRGNRALRIWRSVE